MLKQNKLYELNLNATILELCLDIEITSHLLVNYLGEFFLMLIGSLPKITGNLLAAHYNQNKILVLFFIF